MMVASTSGGTSSGSDVAGPVPDESDPDDATGSPLDGLQKEDHQLLLFPDDGVCFDDAFDVMCVSPSPSQSSHPPVSPLPLGGSLSVERHRRPSYTCTPFPYRRHYAVRRKTAPFVRLVVCKIVFVFWCCTLNILVLVLYCDYFHLFTS